VNLILFGPPGAGKGTQADNLANHFKLHKISTGDLLRSEIDKKTSLGKEIELRINKGSFVSDDLIYSLIKQTLQNKNIYNNFIFDGYPRNLKQALDLNLLLKNHNKKISCVLSLTVDKDTIVKRILGRQTCSKCGLIFNEFYNSATSNKHICDKKFLVKRSDDNEETILKRLDTYFEKTLPILDFYKEQNLLHEINGIGQIGQIFEEIRRIIKTLET
jgi:adenylate kinase